MASRLRIGTALLGATAALVFTTLPASAGDVVITPDREGQPKGKFVALKKDVGRLPSHGERFIETELIQLRIKGDDESKVLTYCVELPTDLKDGDFLKEVEWDKHPTGKKFTDVAGKILYVLTNSFPGIPMKGAKDGVDIEHKWGKDFEQDEVIAATQAAIWHFSDGVELDLSDKRNNDDVKTLYTKLVEQAEKNPITNQPKPTLQIEPTSQSGKSSDKVEKIGPFKVTTTASEVKLTASLPEGVTITDAQGNPLAVQKKDDKIAVQGTGDKVSEFFVQVPANAPDGKATFQLSAEASLSIGRLFVAIDKEAGSDNVAQSLVVAQPQKAKVEADAKADWKLEVKPPTSTTTTTTETTTSTTTTTATTPNNPAPGGSGDDNLASTGASILWPLLGGLALVGAGVGALFVVRRKKAGA